MVLPEIQFCCQSFVHSRHRKERQVYIIAHLNIYAFQMSVSAMLHISCIFHQAFLCNIVMQTIRSARKNQEYHIALCSRPALRRWIDNLSCHLFLFFVLDVTREDFLSLYIAKYFSL